MIMISLLKSLLNQFKKPFKTKKGKSIPKNFRKKFNESFSFPKNLVEKILSNINFRKDSEIFSEGFIFPKKF